MFVEKNNCKIVVEDKFMTPFSSKAVTLNTDWHVSIWRRNIFFPAQQGLLIVGKKNLTIINKIAAKNNHGGIFPFICERYHFGKNRTNILSISFLLQSDWMTKWSLCHHADQLA